MRCRIIGLTLLFGAALLAGCSALRLTYGQAPTLTYWRLDSLVDVSSEQAPQVRAAIDDWYRWHRAEELPRYADLLARVAAHSAQPLTPAQVCGWWDEVMVRLDAAIAQALPQAASLARLLEPAQISHLERRQHKLHERYADDYLQPDRKARQRAQVERIVDRAEDFYGRLDRTHRERIAEAVARAPYDAEQAFAERRVQQQALVAVLRRVVDERPPVHEVQAMLQHLAAQWRESSRADEAQRRERVREFNCRLVAELHNGTDAAQREQARRKLDGYAADLRALAGAAALVTAGAW